MGRIDAKRYLRRWEALLVLFLVVVLAYNITQVSNFLTAQNQANLFQLSIEKAIVALIMTFVIISGEIDLSVASMMGLSAAVTAKLNESGWNMVLAIVAALAVGLALGAIERLLRRQDRDQFAGGHAGRVYRLSRVGAGLHRGQLGGWFSRLVHTPRPERHRGADHLFDHSFLHHGRHRRRDSALQRVRAPGLYHWLECARWPSFPVCRWCGRASSSLP